MKILIAFLFIGVNGWAASSIAMSVSADKINVGSNAILDNPTKMTVAAWVNPTNFTTAPRFFQKGVLAVDSTIWTCESTNTGALSQTFGRTSNLLATSGNAFVSSGTWNFVACSFDTTLAASDQKVFRGTQASRVIEAPSYGAQTAGSGAHPTDASADAYFGNKSNGGNMINGNIAFAAMWNRQLTADELEEFKNKPTSTSPGLVGLWWFGSNGLGLQIDQSGNGNHGTVTGSAVSLSGPPVFLSGGPL